MDFGSYNTIGLSHQYLSYQYCILDKCLQYIKMGIESHCYGIVLTV